MFNVKIILLCTAIFGLTACHSITPQTSKTISGTVTYNERIYLPQNVVLTVKLEDTTKQDVAAAIVAEQSIYVATPPPWTFDLAYDPKAIQKKGHYVLRASVKVEGELRFINATSVPAFNTKEPINIVVSPATKKEISKQAMLEAHSWKLTELNGAAINALNSQNVGINFNAENQSSNGFAGCNQFSGGYEATEMALSFAPMMSTQMACINSDSELNYLQTLSRVRGYTIDGNRLMMLDGANQGLAQFELDGDNLDIN